LCLERKHEQIEENIQQRPLFRQNPRDQGGHPKHPLKLIQIQLSQPEARPVLWHKSVDAHEKERSEGV
jgi:hypothetical protein